MKIKNPTKEKISKGAAALFREQGYQASTLRQIASAIGIKGGSIYYHFDSKQDILFQIMDSTLCELTSIVEEGVRKTKDPLKKLYAAIDIHIRYHVDNLDYTYVADTEIKSLNEENLSVIIAKRKRYENIFKEIISELTADSISKTNLGFFCFTVSRHDVVIGQNQIGSNQEPCTLVDWSFDDTNRSGNVSPFLQETGIQEWRIGPHSIYRPLPLLDRPRPYLPGQCIDHLRHSERLSGGEYWLTL